MSSCQGGHGLSYACLLLQLLAAAPLLAAHELPDDRQQGLAAHDRVQLQQSLSPQSHSRAMQSADGLNIIIAMHGSQRLLDDKMANYR